MAKKNFYDNSADEIAPVTAETIAPIPETKQFDFEIVVLNPFETYKKGDLINSNDEIEAVIQKGFLSNCIKRLRRD